MKCISDMRMSYAPINQHCTHATTQITQTRLTGIEPVFTKSVVLPLHHSPLLFLILFTEMVVFYPVRNIFTIRINANPCLFRLVIFLVSARTATFFSHALVPSLFCAQIGISPFQQHSSSVFVIRVRL